MLARRSALPAVRTAYQPCFTTAEAPLNEVKRVRLELVDDAPRYPKRGRPVILTKRAFLKICHLVEAGLPVSGACEIEQVSYRIFRQRVAASPRLAERLKEATDTRFDLRHEEALASVMAAGQRSWMAHAWWLERNLPRLYALRNVARPDTEQEKELQVEIPAEVLARHRALMLELARGDEVRLKSANLLRAAPRETALFKGLFFKQLARFNLGSHTALIGVPPRPKASAG